MIKVVLGDRDLSLSGLQNTPEQGTPREEVQPVENRAEWLGMAVETASEALATRFGVEYHPGVIVTEVEAGTPADRKNIVPGTIITKIDFKDVRNEADFVRISNELKDRTKAIAFYIFDLNGNIGYVALKP